jgi:type VI secretion system Hcp family effector
MAHDAFCYFDSASNVRGSSADDKVSGLNAFKITGLDIGVERTSNVTDDGLGAGLGQLGPISFTKALDSASTSLYRNGIAGAAVNPFDLVTIDLFDSGQTSPFLKYQFKNAIVLSMSQSADGDTVSESITLDYEAIKVTFTAQNHGGGAGESGVAEWNRLTGLASSGI